MHPIPSLRLLLRPISMNDLNDLFLLQSAPEVAKYNTLGIPKNKKITQLYIETAIQDEASYFKTYLWWAIIHKETGEFLGEAGLTLSKSQYKSGEIFYLLFPKYWGIGYAREAVQTILNYAFVDLGLHRITAGVATKNVRSIHLLEKVGMTKEGKHRKILPIRGEWWDNYHYAILEEDYFKQEE